MTTGTSSDDGASHHEEARKLVWRFGQPRERHLATEQLAALGADALPVLAGVLDGSACDANGMPIPEASETFRCSLVVAGRLGPVAEPLRDLLVRAISSEHEPIAEEAVRALVALGVQEPEYAALANALLGGVDLACEAAVALGKCGATDHPDVRAVLAQSTRARWALDRFSSFRRSH